MRNLLLLLVSCAIANAQGPFHGAGFGVGASPRQVAPGEPITVTASMQNFCEYGDTQRLDYVVFTIEHADVTNVTANLVTNPPLFTNLVTASASYTFNARPQDAGHLILIWAEIWGVDIQFGGIDAPTGAIFGDQVFVSAPPPVALRLAADPAELQITGLTPEKRYTLEISPDTRNWSAGLVFVASTNSLTLPLSYTESQTFFRVRQH